MAVNDTFSLDGFRTGRELPMAEVAIGNHPEAAAAARARILELSEAAPLNVASDVPAIMSDKLVTDRDQLKKTLVATPPVVGARRTIPTIVQPILTAAGIFLLMLVIFKSPVIFSQINYSLHKSSTPAVAAVTATSVIPADPTITIAKINVHAPVVYEPSTDENVFENALQNGVVHYANTAVPGQPGNVAIFGHSSNDWWQPGNYKFVFVLLDKLAPGDLITIDYQSKRYTYEVTGSSVVDPTDVAVLNPTATPTLSLITCTPPGTSWKRLVVTAKQIDPAPATTGTVAATPAPTTTKSLSSGSGGFFHQVGQAWDGLVNGVASLFGGGSSPTPTPAASTSSTTTTTGTLPAAN